MAVSVIQLQFQVEQQLEQVKILAALIILQVVVAVVETLLTHFLMEAQD
jgi:hypothetical protein